MRAPFQIRAIPYRMINESLMYCVFHRADFDQWQFIAGGGENNETPLEAAKREAIEKGIYYAQTLGESIQKFADVLEKELETAKEA